MVESGAFASRKQVRRWYEVAPSGTPQQKTHNREPTWAPAIAQSVPPLPVGHFVPHEARYATDDDDLAAALRQYGCHQRPDGTFIESYAADLAVWLQLTPLQRLAARLHDWSQPQTLPPLQHPVPGSAFSTPHLDRYVHPTYPHRRSFRDRNPWAAIEDDATVQDAWDEGRQPIQGEGKRTLWDDIQQPRERTTLKDDEGRFCTICDRLLSECDCVCLKCKRERSVCTCGKVSDSYLATDDAPPHLTPQQRRHIAASMRRHQAETREEHEERERRRIEPRPRIQRHIPYAATKRAPLCAYLPYRYEEARVTKRSGLLASPIQRRRGRPRKYPPKTAFPGCVQLYDRHDRSLPARAFRLCFPWGIPQDWETGWRIWAEELSEAYLVPREVMEQSVQERERQAAESLVQQLPHDYPEKHYPKLHALARRFVAFHNRTGWLPLPRHATWVPPEELEPNETGLWLPTAIVARIMGIKEGSVNRWHQRHAILADKNGIRAHHYRLEDVIQCVNERAGATDRYFPWHRPPTRSHRPGAA